jgi:hypothetical protein
VSDLGTIKYSETDINEENDGVDPTYSDEDKDPADQIGDPIHSHGTPV